MPDNHAQDARPREAGCPGTASIGMQEKNAGVGARAERESECFSGTEGASAEIDGVRQQAAGVVRPSVPPGEVVGFPGTEGVERAELDRVWPRLQEKVRFAVSMVRRGEEVRARLELVPESLGRLEVVIRCGETVSVRLLAANEEAMRALEQGMERLREALLAQGVRLQDLCLGMAAGGENGGPFRDMGTERILRDDVRQQGDGALPGVKAPVRHGLLDITV